MSSSITALPQSELKALGIDVSESSVFESIPSPNHAISQSEQSEYDLLPDALKSNFDSASSDVRKSVAKFDSALPPHSDVTGDAIANRLKYKYSISGAYGETVCEKIQRLLIEAEEVEQYVKETGTADESAAEMLQSLRSKLAGLSTSTEKSHQAVPEGNKHESAESSGIENARRTLVFVEDKLAGIERAIGNVDISDLYPSLWDAIRDLARRAKLCRPEGIKAAQKQVADAEVLASQLRSKLSAQGNDPVDMLELAQGVRSWRAVSDNLPSLMSRLGSLKELHENAVIESEELVRMVKQKNSILEDLANQKNAAEQLKQSICSTEAAFTQGCEQLEQRIAKLERQST